MLTKDEKSLIQVQALNSFATALASIFLQIYIFRLTGFVGVVFFNLSTYIFLLTFYTLSGFLLRRFSTNTLILGGIFLNVFLYLLLIVLKQNAVNYLFSLGIVNGIGSGLYWSGFNLSQYIHTSSRTRDDYFGKGSSFIYVGSSIGPLLGGLIVASLNSFFHFPYVGYYALFSIVVLINLSLFFIAYKLPAYKGVQFSVKQLFIEKSKKWRLVLQQNVVLGLWDLAFFTLTSILLFQIIKSEAGVGLVRALILILAAVVSFFAGKFLSRFKRLYLLGAIGTALSIAIFAFSQNLSGVIILGFVYGISSPFLNIPLSSATLNTIDENKKSWQEKYHMFLERDGVLGFARVISYFVLYFLFLSFDKTDVAKNWLIVISVFPLILGLLLYKMKKTI